MHKPQEQDDLPTLPWHALIKDLWKWIKPYRTRFFFASFMRLTSDIVSLYPALALAWIITYLSNYKQGQSLDELWITFILICAAYTWRMIGNHWGRVSCYFISEKISLDVQIAATKHLFNLPSAWHEKENTGNKLKRVMRGGNAYDKLLRIWIHNIIKMSVHFIGIPLIIIGIDPFIAGLLGFFSLIYYFLAHKLTKPAVRAVNETNIQDEKYNGLAFEVVHNIRSIQVYGSGSLLLDRIQLTTHALYDAIKKQIVKFTIRNISLESWQLFFRLGTIAFIVVGVIHGRYELGFFVAFNWYFISISESTQELANIAQEFSVAQLSIQRLNAIMLEPTNNRNNPHALEFPKNWKKVLLQNICFSYGENQVLKNISFEVKRGMRVGIVGLSGAGKSTLFKLLMKEHETYTGEILFDTNPLRSLSRDSYFKNVAVVLQETEVFNFSLKDNILISRSDTVIHKKALQESIATAHISDFIQKLPQGIDTLVGEKGVKLSGGEKQRLGIARAIYKQPDLLLLDEATSHLDLESEEKIKDSLHHFFKKVTAIVIAHRLTTIKEMDRIIVVEAGQIVEQGSFDELQRKKGRFAELWEKQKL